ncbi:MAG: hypothetical protein ACI3WS_01375 [Phascolarctobacterium sp.]
MSAIRQCFIVCMLAFALCLFALPCLSAAPAEIPQGYKVVRTEKLELLKSNNDKLVMKLAELQTKLQLLKMPSAELVSELERCRQDLASAKLSLKSAKNLQGETLNSLTALEKEIDAERKQQADRENRLRRQRDTWLFVAGAALIGYIVK